MILRNNDTPNTKRLAGKELTIRRVMVENLSFGSIDGISILYLPFFTSEFYVVFECMQCRMQQVSQGEIGFKLRRGRL